jgi:hypothetical protein
VLTILDGSTFVISDDIGDVGVGAAIGESGSRTKERCSRGDSADGRADLGENHEGDHSKTPYLGPAQYSDQAVRPCFLRKHKDACDLFRDGRNPPPSRVLGLFGGKVYEARAR